MYKQITLSSKDLTHHEGQSLVATLHDLVLNSLSQNYLQVKTFYIFIKRMGFIPGLQELIDESNKKTNIKDVLGETLKKSVSDSGTTLPITDGDAELIAKKMSELKIKNNDPIVDIYRKDSLCVLPPTPVVGHPIYGSEVYQKLYILMLQSGMYVSDDIRRNIWAYIYLAETDSKVLKDDIDTISDKIDETIGKWTLSCDRKMSLNTWISEKKYQG